MQRLMKCCARGALGLGAAALLLSGVPALANPVSGAPDAASRESQPRLLAQTTAQTEEAETLEKRRQEEQRKKMEQQQQEKQQQGIQQKQMRTRGAVPEAAPAPDAATPRPGKSRFGAGVDREKESADGD